MGSYKKHSADEHGWSDWVMPILKGYRMGCCDCGLVHEFEFDVLEGHPIFRARRHSRATAAVRRERRKKEAGIE